MLVTAIQQIITRIHMFVHTMLFQNTPPLQSSVSHAHWVITQVITLPC